MRLRQDRVLGSLLGMAIGDALGMPVDGWPRETVIERYGGIDRYHPRAFDDGAQLNAGEFTDESEGVLCIVESYTANTGELDAENIRARLEILARGESRRWMNPSTLALLEQDFDANAVPPDDAPVTGDVAARGIALGLISAGPPQRNEAVMKQQATLLAGLTHGSLEATVCIEVVAEAIRAIALQVVSLPGLSGYVAAAFPGSNVTRMLGTASAEVQGTLSFDALVARIGYGDSAAQVVATAILAAAKTETFQDAVFAAASQGGAAGARGAIAGALAGAAFGTGGIPQSLIDGLEGRVYVMLAAPWFCQTIQLRNSFGQSMPQNRD